MICPKCKMDPCLCHIPGFGEESGEELINKELKSMIGKKCIVKVTEKGNRIHSMYIGDKVPYRRLTDVYGTIGMVGVYRDTETFNEEDDELLIEDIFEPKQRLIFFVKYMDSEEEGNWFIEEEVILLND